MSDEETGTTREEEIEKICQAILNAIPMEVCMVNIVVALNELSMEFAMELCDCEDEENDDISPIGNLPGTPFSGN